MQCPVHEQSGHRYASEHCEQNARTSQLVHETAEQLSRRTAESEVYAGREALRTGLHGGRREQCDLTGHRHELEPKNDRLEQVKRQVPGHTRHQRVAAEAHRVEREHHQVSAEMPDAPDQNVRESEHQHLRV